MKNSDIIRCSRSTISRRLNIVEEHHLLRDIGNGACVITDEGEAHLEERYDAEEGVYIDENGLNGAGIESEQETNDA